MNEHVDTTDVKYQKTQLVKELTMNILKKEIGLELGIQSDLHNTLIHMPVQMI